MKKIIRLIGERSDLELGYIEGGTYYKTGLLADEDHNWKILNWINNELESGWRIQVVGRCEWEAEDMMDQSKRKNKEVLHEIIENAFRNTKD